MFNSWLFIVHDSKMSEQCCVSSGNQRMSMRQCDVACSIVVHQKHEPSELTSTFWFWRSSRFSLFSRALLTQRTTLMTHDASPESKNATKSILLMLQIIVARCRILLINFAAPLVNRKQSVTYWSASLLPCFTWYITFLADTFACMLSNYFSTLSSLLAVSTFRPALSLLWPLRPLITQNWVVQLTVTTTFFQAVITARLAWPWGRDSAHYPVLFPAQWTVQHWSQAMTS